MAKLVDFSYLDSKTIAMSASKYGTPHYIYDERLILENCKKALSMPNAFGLTIRYAMKANSNRTLLKIIHSSGLLLDSSSMNEVRRAVLAGLPLKDILLTTQELPSGEDLNELKIMILDGLKYNVCSLNQLYNIGDFAAENKVNLSVRIHPGTGSGESATRNTGDNYSCFGIHLSDIDKALRYAKEKGIVFDMVHTHIGSGGDPEAWKKNIDFELDIVEKLFPDVKSVNFGGGLKIARMPDEKAADIEELGLYARDRMEEFYKKTGRKLQMEVEPGTFIIGQTGFIVTKVMDKKSTGENGYNFLVLDGGMELNTRPLLYASRHPFHVVSKEGDLLSSEFNNEGKNFTAIPVGRCCESGDSQSLDASGLTIPRQMGEPQVGDYFVIGGCGAYCSSMSPMNYNSHEQEAEILFTNDGDLKVIRRKQSLIQMLENEA